jgi:putative Mn2+ efflux pump MntP
MWIFNFVYVHRGIAKLLTRYIRVKAHAIGVSILTFTLGAYFILAIFSKQEYKLRLLFFSLYSLFIS